jgi:hypothetical protein
MDAAADATEGATEGATAVAAAKNAVINHNVLILIGRNDTFDFTKKS